jgi:two-component sensor histidine kinase
MLAMSDPSAPVGIRQRAWRYAAAAASALAAFGVTVFLWPLIKPTVSPVFIVSVMFSAWYGGFGPGLLATVMASVLSAYFLMEPSYSVMIGGDDLARLIVFASIAVVVNSLTATRRQAEAKLTDAVRRQEELTAQKSLLLQEAHHRVKNNLQVISSLLSLQSEQLHDHQAKHALEESQGRIRTMALIHEQLHQVEGVADVDFKEYLGRLLPRLAQSCDSSGRVRIHAQLDELTLPLSAAIPCALLINEVVSNAFEHAFAPGAPGQVWVRLQADASGVVKLSIWDNGRGLPQAHGGEESSGLGLRLVHAFVEQLKGTLTVFPSHGTAFVVEFPWSKSLAAAATPVATS